MTYITTFFSTLDFYHYFAFFLNILLFIFIYINRKALLFHHNNLSLGRVWSWIIFYIAVSYWARFILGIIPPSTPFPPCLDELLFACLFYELFKKCLDKDILTLILTRKAKLPLDNNTSK